MRFFLLLSLALTSLTISAQELQFGFGVDASHSRFQLPELTHQEMEVISVDDYYAENFGFALSLFSRVAINNKFSLSFSPTVLLNGARVIDYFHLNTPPRIYKAALVFPVALEWQSRQGKWQPFATVGLGPLFNLTDRAYPSGFNIPNEFWFGQLSAGFNCNTSAKFDIRPELVFRHSLSDLVRGDLSDVYKVDWQYLGLRILFIAD